jgi:hypothetical protein
MQSGMLQALWFEYGPRGVYKDVRSLREIDNVEEQLDLSGVEYTLGLPSNWSSQVRRIHQIMADNADQQHLYIDFNNILLVSNYEDCYSFSNVSASPDYEPYKPGIIAIDTSSINRLLKSYHLCSGKILDVRNSPRGEYIYTFQVLSDGPVTRRHNQLIPAAEYFEKTTFNVVRSTVDCNSLFSVGEKFVLRGGYYHNRDSSVILEEKEFSKFFKLEENAVSAKTSIG